MDAMLRGLFGGSVGHIEITGKRNGKTDEEIAEIVDKTIKDIISGMAGAVVGIVMMSLCVASHNSSLELENRQKEDKE